MPKTFFGRPWRSLQSMSPRALMASWSTSRLVWSCSRCLAMKSSFMRLSSLWNSGPFRYLKQRSSSSALMLHTPSLLARGTKTWRDSWATSLCLWGASDPRVRMLWRRSASFISTVRTSPMDRSMFLKRSLWVAGSSSPAPSWSRLRRLTWLMRLTPTTMSETPAGMNSRSCLCVIMVSSRTSWSRPAATVSSSRPRLARMSAVSTT
mmetsp:Transcript_3127/g.7672  ORF Transcript_3127/g.7672 Transcript_3127/m.7672 type:complete len:207 (-) Transcript_3127:824-1444(-)